MAEPKIFELNNGSMQVKVSNLGCTILSLSVPDKNGNLGDVVLGFDTLEPYQKGLAPYFGCIVGRVSDRIQDGKFSLNGVDYTLSINKPPNSLHGGHKGFDKVVWEVAEHKEGEHPSITFKYHSRDGEEGYPGDLSVTATYMLTSKTTLRLDMEAVPANKATPVSLAQHTYWNLGGHNSGDILDNTAQIWANLLIPDDNDDPSMVPTGQIVLVYGTPFDFTSEKQIGRDMQQVTLGYFNNYGLDDCEEQKDDCEEQKDDCEEQKDDCEEQKDGQIGRDIQQVGLGYDHNYMLDCGDKKDGLQHAAKIKDPKSSRVLDLWTNAPAMQFYTANDVNGIVGKGGAVYNKHSGVCLQTQGFPNAINVPTFPSVVVQPGDKYIHNMVYEFSVE